MFFLNIISTVKVLSKLYWGGVQSTKGNFIRIKEKKNLDMCLNKHTKGFLNNHKFNNIRNDEFVSHGNHANYISKSVYNSDNTVDLTIHNITHNYEPLNKRVWDKGTCFDKVVLVHFQKIKDVSYTLTIGKSLQLSYEDFIESLIQYQITFSLDKKAKFEDLKENLSEVSKNQKIIKLGTDEEDSFE